MSHPNPPTPPDEDDDELDGCDLDFVEGGGTTDADIDGTVLFADVDPTDAKAVEARKREWEKVFKK